MICKHCKNEPVVHPQKSYCSDFCYREAKRIREARRKTPPKPTARVITCLGPCGRPFMSSDPKYNRICSRCSGRIEQMVPLNGW